MLDLDLELSIEQQFLLRRYESEVARLPAGEARAMLLEVLRQLMIKDSLVKQLVAKVL